MDWCKINANSSSSNSRMLFAHGLRRGDISECLLRAGSNPVVLSALPLVFLLVCGVIPALTHFLRMRSRSNADCEQTPLIAPNSEGDSSNNTAQLTGMDHDWVLAAEEPSNSDSLDAQTSPDRSGGLPLTLFRGVGHLLSVLLVVAACRWELVNELSDGASDSSNWLASLFFIAQMAIALALFVGYAKEPVAATPSMSQIYIQFAKRHHRLILMRLTGFHVLSATVWAFVIMAAWPLWEEGEVSTQFLSLAVAMLVGGYLMAVVCLLVRGKILTKRIHRIRVDGKIPCPEQDADLLSRVSFAWFNPMMAFGYKQDLVFDDLWDLNPSEKIERNLAAYRRIQLRSPTALLQSIWLLERVALMRQFALVLTSTTLYLSGPFFLNRILTHLTNRGSKHSEPEWVAYAYVLGILVTALLRFALEGQITLSARKIGMRVCNTLSGLVYLKSLRRVPRLAVEDAKNGSQSNDSAGASMGKIVNLMSVDASSVGEWIGVVYTPFITFIQIVMCVLSLLFVLGWPAIAGVIMMVLLMFSGAPLASSINKSFTQLKKSKDVRVNAMNELLQGIKIIKLFSWEKQFTLKMTRLRDQELSDLFKLYVLTNINRVLWVSAPILTTFVTLGTYTKIAGRELDATTAFTALALFNLLRGPLQTFPDTLVSLLDVWVSVKRIKQFLLEDELERFTSGVDGQSMETDACKMKLKSASFEWPEPDKASVEAVVPTVGFFKRTWRAVFGYRAGYTPLISEASIFQTAAAAEPSFKLADMDIEFPSSKLSVVVGATGAGKTSLILSLLGETTRLSGTRECPNAVAYVSQTAWLTNATIRENILFGTLWDPVRYRRVVQACALAKDFELLEGGDMTEVGEKGINLSGGQKQRISLARAAYSKSQFVVLDDPLSAVDAPTARHLFEQCILGLLANRTRILVTNAVGLAMPCADHLVIVNGGRISTQGSVESVLQLISSKSSDMVQTPFSEGLAEMSALVMSERAKYLSSSIFLTSSASVEFLEQLDTDSKAPHYTTEYAGSGSKLTEVEKMESGNVKLKVYGLYAWAMGGVPFLALLLTGYSLNHALAIFQDVVVSWWSSEYKNKQFMLRAFQFVQDASSSYMPSAASFHKHSVDPPSGSRDEITDYYLTLYGIVGALCMLAILARLLILSYGVVRAARELHVAMLDRVMKAPLRFFEVTPLGRIMNRFTKDMGAVDREVGASAGNTVYNLIAATFVIGTVLTVIPGLALLLIPVAYLYYRVGMYYIRTSRSLKRIESVVRSPIFSHFSETLNGVTTIRAFHALPRFTSESSRRFDVANRAFYFLIVANLWLSVRIQSLGAVIVFCAATLIVATGVSAGLAGLCLNFTLSLTDTLIAVVRMQSWMEMSMNSIERCDEYINLDQEAQDVVPANRPPANWPSSGEISIKDLELRYSPDSPLVLRGISADIGAREKVGIVGRTGAGKSSLTLAFFRIVEPSAGSIFIDGVDTGKIGLEDLRSNLTIIPQDPILFAGTVRSNIDPFGTIPEEALLEALERSHLVPKPGSSELKRLPHAASTSSITTIIVEDDATNTSSSKHEKQTNSSASQNEPKNEAAEFSLTLDSPISEGGSNLSCGQRQLLCLARALAKGSKVIMLDEATASVDTETDGRIQSTIRSEFGGSTVLTIAHRLKTIVDYDRVIVLDHGQIVENGRPIDLIEKSRVGVFRSMCEETGEFEDLVALAKK
ncbi:hypothetical protein BJ741DRAFT_607321 [Chytriomyces cf. hyalinus JEL632]|nr:hypothetical protein BJ741DRAFT_607321 [Chytriomyces cf. hyalinus JEL632]